jgi:hypothetical protein
MAVGNIILFSEAFDINQYNGDNTGDTIETEATVVRQQYVSFTRWFNRHYRVWQHDEELDGLGLFRRSALKFALSTYRYYQVCIKEDRSSIGDRVKSQALLAAFRTGLRAIYPPLTKEFMGSLSAPVETRSLLSYFDDISILRRDHAGASDTSAPRVAGNLDEMDVDSKLNALCYDRHLIPNSTFHVAQLVPHNGKRGRACEHFSAGLHGLRLRVLSGMNLPHNSE